jgi:hypothetical protein
LTSSTYEASASPPVPPTASLQNRQRGCWARCPQASSAFHRTTILRHIRGANAVTIGGARVQANRHRSSPGDGTDEWLGKGRHDPDVYIEWRKARRFRGTRRRAWDSKGSDMRRPAPLPIVAFFFLPRMKSLSTAAADSVHRDPYETVDLHAMPLYTVTVLWPASRRSKKRNTVDPSKTPLTACLSWPLRVSMYRFLSDRRTTKLCHAASS